jgi:choline dehydrogenase-like flavoprotein
MSKQPDPFRAGLARGWKVINGQTDLPASLSCDVAIVGTGAGAGISAELLSRSGLHVVLVEEGPLKTSTDFNQRELEAYSTLYQEAGGRKTKDKAITLLQGRSVGGSTTINWTSSFRTPPATLEHWQRVYGLKDLGVDAMAPWFEQVERRLNMHPWEIAPNENNELLRKGATKLGIEAKIIPRNVKGCWNLGSCGMGCPTNAKQSMLVTTIPAALDAGAQLLYHTRAEKFEFETGRVKTLVCRGVAQNGDVASAGTLRIQARHYIVAGGAINSPALLLRSHATDPHQRLGKRTFLHPVVVSAALYDHPVDGWAGAPQSIYTDHFLHTQPVDGPIGYKLEVPPLHPVFAATQLGGYGLELERRVKNVRNTHVLIALLRDGFHERSQGGQVQLRGDGSPVLDYPLNDFLFEGMRRAYLSMAEIQFAAGAIEVLPIHETAEHYASWDKAQAALQALPMQPLTTFVGSAHLMGGCTMAADETQGVVRPDGVHWQIDNLSVHDGSLFPTSIGANPQLSIYGLTNKLTSDLIRRLGGQPVTLA